MKKRISDKDLKYLMWQIKAGCSISGDVDEYYIVEDLSDARSEIKKLKTLVKSMKWAGL
jgi:hypothetical protein